MVTTTKELIEKLEIGKPEIAVLQDRIIWASRLKDGNVFYTQNINSVNGRSVTLREVLSIEAFKAKFMDTSSDENCQMKDKSNGSRIQDKLNACFSKEGLI